MEMVVRECQERSCMTYSFTSKRQLKRFERWFYRQGKKHFEWSKWKAKKEFLAFIEAFNVKIDDN
jgi:hypothetical protein